MLWRGTAASAINLNTPGKLWYSMAYAASETTQVGYGHGPITGGFADHALLWHGTPESMVDLHPFLNQLGPSFSISNATAIDAKGNIYGWARDNALNAVHAVKWSLVPEPNAALLTLGSLCALVGFRRHGNMHVS
jgi:hypothetical protein